MPAAPQNLVQNGLGTCFAANGKHVDSALEIPHSRTPRVATNLTVNAETVNLVHPYEIPDQLYQRVLYFYILGIEVHKRDVRVPHPASFNAVLRIVIYPA